MSSTDADSLVSISTEPSVIAEANPEDVIRDLQKLDKERKAEWEALFNKYETQDSHEDSVDVEDISKIFNHSRASVSSKILDTCKTKNRNTICTINGVVPPLSFLYKWTTPDKLNKIAKDFAKPKINLSRLIRVVEEKLHSDLKHLLVFHEEARYLRDESFVECHQVVYEEIKRLHKSLDNQYIVCYILLHKCDISMDEIIPKIEKEHNGNLLECLSLATHNNTTNARIKTLLHQKFVREWNRLRQNVPTDYLVAYCNMIEMELLKFKVTHKDSSISPLQLLKSSAAID